MKTPIERVMELYRKKKSIEQFETDLLEYGANGIVINSPTCFAMLKALEYADKRCAWFIEAAAGKVSEIVAQLPAPMPFVAFCRFNDKNRRMRFYEWDRFVPKLLKLC